MTDTCTELVGVIDALASAYGHWGGQWVVDILDYLVMKCPTPLVSVLFGSLIPTFCLIFEIVFYS